MHLIDFAHWRFLEATIFTRSPLRIDRQFVAILALAIVAIGGCGQQAPARELQGLPPGSEVEAILGGEDCRDEGACEAMLHINGAIFSVADVGVDEGHVSQEARSRHPVTEGILVEVVLTSDPAEVYVLHSEVGWLRGTQSE